MKTIRRIVLSALFFSICMSVSAQHVNTLYFLENQPYRHYINPSFQPISKVYVSLPVIGYTSLWAGNNSLTLKDIVYTQDDKTIWCINPDADPSALLNKLRASTLIDVSANLNLLSFGFRIKENGYFHLNINERVDAGAALPKGLFNLVLGGGMSNTLNSYDDVQKTYTGQDIFDLKQLGLNAALYTEVSFGYSHNINEQISVGGAFKFLYGSAYMGMTNSELNLNTSIDEWSLKGAGQFMFAAPFAGPANFSVDGFTEWGSNLGNVFSDWKKLLLPSGLGAGIDLGATYKPITNLSISASVTDLGFIRWNKGTRYDYQVDGTFTGIGEIVLGDYKDEDGKINGQAIGDTIVARLTEIGENAFSEAGRDTTGFTRMTTPSLNIGVDANFWNNRVGVGVYSRTRFVNSKAYEEITLGAAFRPVHWFQIAASYSFMNGRGSNIGAAIGIVTYEGIGLTLACDYIPCYYAGLASDGAKTKYVIPYNTKGVNFALGLNIVCGHKDKKATAQKTETTQKQETAQKKSASKKKTKGVSAEDFDIAPSKE